MKKRILSMMLALAMVLSMFAGVTLISSAAEATWVKVTEAPADWSGEYIIVCEEANVVFNASLETLDVVKNNAAVEIVNGTIVADLDAYKVTIAAVEGGYSIQTAAGFYIGNTADSNKLTSSTSTAYVNTISLDADGNIVVLASGGSYLRYNATSGQERFRYFKSGTYTSQKAISLYKVAEGNVCTHEGATSVVTTPAACTEDGVMTWNCAACSATWTTVIEATGHDLEETITLEAKCETEGAKTVSCKICDYTKDYTINALGHLYNDGKCERCNAPAPADEAFIKLTDASELTAGMQIIFVSAEAYEENFYGMMNYVSGNNVKAEVITIAENGSITVSADSGVCIYTLGGEEGAWTLYDGAKYLYTSSTGSNRLQGEAELDADGYGLWNISIADGVASIVNVTNTARGVMQFNGSSALFNCYSSASQKAISIYGIVPEGVCIHEVAEWTLATAASCTEDGTETGVCTKCGEPQTRPVAATGHETSIKVVDGTVVMACAKCPYSEAVALNTLTEAKTYTDKKVVYNVKGVVTYIEVSTSGTTVFIEENGEALCVYFANTTDVSTLALGDEIYVSGTMTTYNGLVEVNKPAEYLTLSTGNALPNNTTVTIADILADTTNEFLGERVTLTDLTVGVVNTSGATALTDATGNTINAHKAAFAENVTEGDVITITAIVSTYNGYQLKLNPGTAATDVIVTKEAGEVTVETVTIAEAKAGTVGTYYQVEGVVTFVDGRNVYIQDETGALVVYLTSNAAATAIGDKVKAYGALKLYKGLIELDSVNEADTKFYEVLSNGNTVAAQAVTLADLAADATNEYLAEKVTLTKLEITEVGTWNESYANVDYTVTDGTNTMKLYRAPAATAEDVLEVGEIINIEAIVSSYDGYQLRIVSADKISVEEPAAPIYDDAVKFSHSLTLQNDISINFIGLGSALSVYESFYLECKVPVYEGNELVGYETVNIEPVFNGKNYECTLLGITAKMMNNNIEAVFHMTDANGQEYYSKTDVYSVAEYAYGKLDSTKAADTAELKAICANLLRYGSLAQVQFGYRTDALVDAEMTDAHKALLTDLSTVEMKDYRKQLNDLATPTVPWKSTTLELGNKVIMCLIANLANYTGDPSTLTMRLTYTRADGTVIEDERPLVLYNPEALTYAVSYDGLRAADMRTIVSAAIYENGVRVSKTVEYSIETYGARSTDAAMQQLCRAMLAYGDATNAYFNN